MQSTIYPSIYNVTKTMPCSKAGSKTLFFSFIFVCFLLAVGLAGGGGESPDKVTQTVSFIYLKGIFLLLPVLALIYSLSIDTDNVLTQLFNIIRGNKFYYIMLLLMMGSLPLSLNIYYSSERYVFTLYAVASMASLITLFFVHYKDTITNGLNNILTLAAYTIIAYVLFCIFNNATFGNLFSIRDHVYNQNMIHPNLLASFTSHIILTRFFVNKKIQVIDGLLVAIFLLLFSRTAYVGLYVSLLLGTGFLFLNSGEKRYLTIGAIIVFVTCSLFLTMFVNPDYFNIILSFFSRSGDTEALFTLTNRTVLWQSILEELTIKEIFFGRGYSIIASDYSVNFGTGVLYGAHNGFLSVFLGNGFLALIALIMFLLKTIIKSIIENKHIMAPAVFAGCINFIINCQLAEEVGVNLTLPCFWLVLISTILFCTKKVRT